MEDFVEDWRIGSFGVRFMGIGEEGIGANKGHTFHKENRADWYISSSVSLFYSSPYGEIKTI